MLFVSALLLERNLFLKKCGIILTHIWVKYGHTQHLNVRKRTGLDGLTLNHCFPQMTLLFLLHVWHLVAH